MVIANKKGKEGDKFLAAYYVSNEAIDASALRAYLAARLPEYMIPSYFVHLESMPSTPNRKINRKALPDPGKFTLHEYTAPKNEIESKLLSMWQQVLKMDDIGTQADFFLVGGNSFKLIQLFKLIDEQYPRMIKVMNLFKNRTIASLAEHIIERTTPPKKQKTSILDF